MSGDLCLARRRHYYLGEGRMIFANAYFGKYTPFKTADDILAFQRGGTMGSWSGVCVGLGHSPRLSLSNLRRIKLESRCSSKFRCCGTVRQSVGLNSEYKVWGIRGKRVRVQGIDSKSWSCEELMSFLEADLPHLFDEQGIDKSMYEKDVKFRDPITKHDSLDGYLFNISLLRLLFRPLFQLHSLQQTGPNEITTRWTMVMKFGLLPWRPELTFTGTSVMSINPETGKFWSHVDYWDSIKQNDYFSLEGLMDVVKQLRIFKTPDLETPKYQILKRTADYEVRKYEPFIVIETKGDKLTGSSGFKDVTGYIFGKNAKNEKIPMTTPVFTQTIEESSQVQIQIVLPLERKIPDLPEPPSERLKLREIEGNIVAVTKFSGKATEEIVFEKENNLRAALIRDGIQPKPGCMLARYNDPNRTWSFMMRNEILIPLETFVLR